MRIIICIRIIVGFYSSRKPSLDTIIMDYYCPPDCPMCPDVNTRVCNDAVRSIISMVDILGPRLVCENAARSGNLAILQWLAFHHYRLDNTIFMYAAECGHLDILKWGARNEYHWDDNIYLSAVACRHQHIIDWLKKYWVYTNI